MRLVMKCVSRVLALDGTPSDGTVMTCLDETTSSLS